MGRDGWREEEGVSKCERWRQGGKEQKARQNVDSFAIDT
jgi:hypothetical protein